MSLDLPDDKMMMLLGVSAVLLGTAMLYTFYIESRVQNEPYMDEIFHVYQAQNYCVGNFSHWDPMITTLPGLYLVSVGILKPLAVAMNISTMAVCSTTWLRGINLLFTFGNFYVIYALLKKLHNPLLDQDGVKLIMTTFALSSFPVLYFFATFYYTDPGSTFFVLFMYLFCQHDNHIVAALFGLVAILFRQTNIIWVVFLAGLAIRRELFDWLRVQLEKKEMKFDELDDMGLLKVTCVTLLDCMQTKKQLLKNLFLATLRNIWGYALVCVGFGIFIYFNQGVVVGDRTQHTACAHFPQLFYFFSMTNFFAIFHLCSPYKILDFCKFCFRKPHFVVFFILISIFMIHFFTYEHKYLLADNRHYAFYIWRKIYKRHEYVKYALIPVYLFFTWSIVTELKHRDVFWKVIYAVCVFLATVPQKLLEYRYFILPYVIFRINMRYGSAVALFHEILLYSVVNVLTIYLFIERPFKWPHEEGLQRFMW